MHACMCDNRPNRDGADEPGRSHKDHLDELVQERCNSNELAQLYMEQSMN